MNPIDVRRILEACNEELEALEIKAVSQGGNLSYKDIQATRATIWKLGEEVLKQYHGERVRSGQAKGFASARGKPEAEQKPQIQDAILYARSYPPQFFSSMKERVRDFLVWRQSKDIREKLRYRPGKEIGETQAGIHLREADVFLSLSKKSKK